jgi:hypothetical protein
MALNGSRIKEEAFSEKLTADNPAQNHAKK